ncbi:MAG: hypothetical protein ACRBCJ_05080 [Hyphomicrobiaceae bacterium]
MKISTCFEGLDTLVRPRRLGRLLKGAQQRILRRYRERLHDQARMNDESIARPKRRRSSRTSN